MRKICSLMLLAALSAGIFCSCRQQDERAKYIFLFIGDGMGLNSVIAAESYLSYKANGSFEGEELTFTQFPCYGMSTTYSADSFVTDSAAGGTAIACGVKANNHTVGVDAAGNPVNSVAYELKQEGYQVGIISTAQINHATPADFYAHSTDRFGYYDISTQIPQSGFDYFAGAGFIDSKGANGTEEPIQDYLERNGYAVGYGVEEFLSRTSDKGKAVFCQESTKEGSEDYTTDGKSAEDLTLGQMLELGMEHLDMDKPFFFMCEGGRIDWKAHHNRMIPMIMDIVEMDEAVAVAYEFYLKHKDETLIIVTSDHETGGLSVGDEDYSFDWAVVDEPWEKAGRQDHLSDEEHAELNAKAKIGWTSRRHTGGPVPVFSVGKGSEKFTGKMSNTDFKSRLLQIQEKD